MLDSEVIDMPKKTVATAALVLILVGVLAYAGLASNGKREVSFVDAVEQGLIAFDIRGIHGLVSIDLRIENKSGETLKIVISPGVVLYAVDDSVQDLVVVGNVVVVLVPVEDTIVSVPIACADMMAEQPTDDTVFKTRVGKLTLSAFERLINSEAYQTATFRLKQFALWLLISTPETRYDFAGLGLGGDFFTTFEALFGVTEEELGALCYTLTLYPERLMTLTDDEFSFLSAAFTLAGIPIQDSQDLYDLFTLGIPTKGELAEIYSLYETVGIDPAHFPVLTAVTGGTT